MSSIGYEVDILNKLIMFLMSGYLKGKEEDAGIVARVSALTVFRVLKQLKDEAFVDYSRSKKSGDISDFFLEERTAL